VIGSGSARVSRVGFGVSPKQAFRRGTFRKRIEQTLRAMRMCRQKKFAMA